MQAGRRRREQDGCRQVLVGRDLLAPDCFGRLYDRYVGPVYRYAYGRLGSHEDAEDITAQTFRNALTGLRRLTDGDENAAPFEAWLFRIAHNCVIDRYRSRRPTAHLADVEESRFAADSSPGPDDVLLAREAADTAWAAVALLPELQRRAIVLRFSRDLTHAEVGAIIGRSEAATKQLIYRAVQTLRRQLSSGDETLASKGA